MADSAFWTTIVAAIVAALAALGGVAITTRAESSRERQRIDHEVAVRQAERAATVDERRRTFEIENLLASYDSIWKLSRDMASVHLADLEIASVA